MENNLLDNFVVTDSDKLILTKLKKNLLKLSQEKRSIGITTGILIAVSEVNKLIGIKDEETLYDILFPQGNEGKNKKKKENILS